MKLKKYTYGETGVDPKLRFHASMATLEQEDFEPHTHEYSELVLTLSGTGGHTINSVRSIIQTGDIFVFNGNNHHSFEDTRQLTLVNIAYDPRVYLRHTGDLRKLSGYHALFLIEPHYRTKQNFRSHLRLNPKDLLLAGELARVLIREVADRPTGYQTVIQSAFLQLVALLSRKYGQSSPAPLKNSIQRLASAVAFIENHYTEKITLEELAQLSHLSKNQFLRVFQETYHTTPMNYLNDLRMTKSCEDLRHSNEKITQIALENGFSDSNYFSRLFRKKMGVSPKEYKNRQ